MGDSEPERGDFSERVIQVRHDLRNPLAHIMGFSELLAEAARTRRYDESLRDLRAMEEGCDRLIPLINSTLEPSLVASGGADLAGLESAIKRLVSDVQFACLRLVEHARGRNEEHFLTDLERINGAALRLGELVEDGLRPLGAEVAQVKGIDRQHQWIDPGYVLVFDLASLCDRDGAEEAGRAVEQVSDWERRLGELANAASLSWTLGAGGVVIMWNTRPRTDEEALDAILLTAAAGIAAAKDGSRGLRAVVAKGPLLTGVRSCSVMGGAVLDAIGYVRRIELNRWAVSTEIVDQLGDRYVTSQHPSGCSLVDAVSS